MKRTISGRRSAGFTLIETIVTVAIVVILSAVAFPGLSSLTQGIWMNELDASAREIYLAAQNQLTALRTGGSLSTLSEARTLSSSSLRYLSSSDASDADALAALLPSGAIDPAVAGNYYAIAFNPDNGSVYEVFYSEGPFVLSDDLPRDLIGRSSYDPRLGYYGGGSLQSGGSAATALSSPRITVTNGETLALKLSFAGKNPFDDLDDGTYFQNLSCMVTVRSATSPASSATCVFSSDVPFSPIERDPGSYSFALVLDSLSSHFAALCPGIVPGDDLLITVTASYGDATRVTLPASVSVTVNSLFSSRTDSTVYVACARHLQNLEPSVSGVSTVTAAVQTGPVDWSAAGVFLVPISNAALTSYNGSGLPISGLAVDTDSNYAGLFGLFSGGSLSKIRLTDAMVSGGAYTGALAGKCAGSTVITGCAVYVKDTGSFAQYAVTGAGSVGGLVGYADALQLSGSFAAPGAVSGGASGGDLGGLIGYLGAGSTVSGCYADTALSCPAGADLGGLIGHNAGAAVTDCYALGALSPASGAQSGGFVGRSVGGSYSDCYSAALFASGDSSGFSGSSGGSFTNCAYMQTDGVSDGTPDGRVGVLSFDALKAWSGGDGWAGTASANSHPYSSALLQAVAGGAAYPFPRRSDLEQYNDWPESSGGGSALPTDATFAYYETYQDGTTGYYAADADGSILIDTLSDDKGALVDDGYGLLATSLLKAEWTPETGWYSELHFYHEIESGMHDVYYEGSPLTVTITQDSDSETYYRYDVPKWFLIWSCDDYAAPGLYEKVVFPLRNGDLTCWYSPHSAKAVVNNTTSAPSFDGAIALRSTRQLTTLGLSAAAPYWGSGVSIRQELDLDFTLYNAYSSSYAIHIGQSSSLPFQGSYDGQGYSITLLPDFLYGEMGLFLYNAGTVRDVHLTAGTGFSVGTNSNPGGFLAGTNTGSISACSVTFGADMQAQGNPFGLFVGSNAGSITDCLVTTTAAVTFKAASSTIAGFAGANSGTIQSCFVRPGVTSYAGLTLTDAKAAAGFVGTNSGTVADCAATGTVTAGAYSGCSAAGFVITNAGTVSGSYANCLTTGYSAAGFACDSSAAAAVIRNSYAMLKVYASSSDGGGAAGFVLKGNAKVADCYAVTQVTGVRSDLTYSFTGDTCGTNCGYLSWKSCGYHLTGTALAAEDFAARYSDSAVWRASTEANTHVYLEQDSELGTVCPYPILAGADHYGDWLDEAYYTPPSAMFVYYEQYGDGSYGYYTLGSDGSAVLYDTLSDTSGPVYLDGYAYLTPVTLSSSDRTASYQSSSSGTSQVWLPDPSTISLALNGTAEPYYRYTVPTDVLNSNYASAAYYQSFRVAGVTYWYNPHFAKAAVTGASAIPSFGGTVSVRSPRQLTALGNTSHSAYWQSGFTFRQELELSFPLASVSYSILSPIGTSSASPFAGVYDGGGFPIYLDSNAKGNRNALFGYSSGTLKNVSIRLSGGMAMGVGGSVSGVLSATNTGTIENCVVVYGSSLTPSGSLFGTLAGSNSGTLSDCLVTSSGSASVSGYDVMLGGLAGENTGSITDCHVRPGSSAYGALTFSANKPAGFVYRNNGTVSDCSATATVTAPNYSNYYAAGFVSQNNATIRRSYANCVTSGFFAAGFAYNSVADASSIEDCYAMLKVTSSVGWSAGGAAGFVYNSNSSGNIRSCYAAAQVSGYRSYTFSASGSPGSDCYYLNWDGCGSIATGTGCGYSSLNHAFDSDADWGDADTHVYLNLYTSLPDACPFPLITGLDHYGDWPVFVSVPLAETERTLGVFSYEQGADGNCYITAGSVQYTLNNSGNAVISSTSSQFMRVYADLSSYLSTHALADSGFGVFWPKNLDSPNKFSVNDTTLSSVDTVDDLELSSYYYFVPLDDAAEIGYAHDNSGKRDWTVFFDYTRPANIFTITIH